MLQSLESLSCSQLISAVIDVSTSICGYLHDSTGQLRLGCVRVGWFDYVTWYEEGHIDGNKAHWLHDFVYVAIWC